MVDVLNEVWEKAQSVQGSAPGTPPGTFLADYLAWSEAAVTKLAEVFSLELVDHYIRTPGYWALRASDKYAARLIPSVLQELDQRTRTLEALIKDLREELQRWAGPFVIAVPDTNVFHDHDGQITKIDWTTCVRVDSEDLFGVHVVVPLAVLRELDRHKRSGSKELRATARHASKEINQHLRDSPSVRVALVEGAPGSPAVTIEAYDHPLTHGSSDADGDIIDVCAWLAAVTGRPNMVRLITGDNNMVLRANSAGVRSIQIPNMPPLPEEPA